MKYESVHDESFRGYDIAIFVHQDASCTVDVKYPCGELIEGWCYIEDFEKAMHLAKMYIHTLGDYKNVHCEDEHCQILV